MDIQDSVRKETIGILRALAAGTWTRDRLYQRDEPGGSSNKTYRMAWSLLVHAGHAIDVEIVSGQKAPSQQWMDMPAVTAGWTISLSGLEYLRELEHPLRVRLERNWFPVAVVGTTILSIVVSAVVTIILRT